MKVLSGKMFAGILFIEKIPENKITTISLNIHKDVYSRKWKMSGLTKILKTHKLYTINTDSRDVHFRLQGRKQKRKWLGKMILRRLMEEDCRQWMIQGFQETVHVYIYFFLIPKLPMYLYNSVAIISAPTGERNRLARWRCQKRVSVRVETSVKPWGLHNPEETRLRVKSVQIWESLIRRGKVDRRNVCRDRFNSRTNSRLIKSCLTKNDSALKEFTIKI